jgi:hypothetical protein
MIFLLLRIVVMGLREYFKHLSRSMELYQSTNRRVGVENTTVMPAVIEKYAKV